MIQRFPVTPRRATRRVTRRTAALALLPAAVVLLTGTRTGAFAATKKAATKKTATKSTAKKTGATSRTVAPPTEPAAPPAVGVKCTVLGAVATDAAGQTLLCLRRGTDVVWSPAVPTTVAATPAPPPTAAPVASAPVAGQGLECLNGKWNFAAAEAQGVWEQYGIAMRVLQGTLEGAPVFTGGASITFAGGAVTGTGSVVMKANAKLATQEKYDFDITWTPIATGRVTVSDGRLELSGATTSLFAGALRVSGRAVNGGTVIAPRDGSQSIAFRCEKSQLTVFLPTFLSDADGDKLFTYTLSRG